MNKIFFSFFKLINKVNHFLIINFILIQISEVKKGYIDENLFNKILETIDKFNFSTNTKKVELNIRNKLLNSLLKISYLENNSHLCNLLFTNANIFKNPYEGFAYLSYSEILFNLLKFHSQKNNITNYNLLILNILTNISLDELNDLFNCMNKRLFHDYNLIEFFLSILIKYFSFLKIKEEYINQKMSTRAARRRCRRRSPPFWKGRILRTSSAPPSLWAVTVTP